MPEVATSNKGTNTGYSAGSDAAASEGPDSAGSSKAAVLAEYTGLKIDQTQKMVLREISIYLSLFANAAIAALYALQSHDTRLLLLIPFASALLFWIYVSNDSAINQIRRYISVDIAPKLSGAAANNGGIFGWDYLRRQGFIGRWLSKALRFLLVWFTFFGAPLAALAVNAPAVQDMGHDWFWLAAAISAGLPYLLWLWFIVF